MSIGDIELEQPPARRGWRLWSLVLGSVKFFIAVVLCMTPITAVLALGWLTRKTQRDIASRSAGQRPGPWPNLLRAEDRHGRSWRARGFGAVWSNTAAGIRAWAGVLLLTLPFALVWLTGWFAGWQNSFNKGYEFAGVWPGISLLAVVLSLPILTLLPMAIAHQAATGPITSILQLGTIARLARHGGWSYLGLTILVGIGCMAVLPVRAMPVFAEQISDAIAHGAPGAADAFAVTLKFWATVLLFTGLLAMRHVMARVYAAASARIGSGRRPGRIKSAVVFIACALIWLWLVFLIYLGQFLNYAWWSWINQPVLMLPWFAVV